MAAVPPASFSEPPSSNIMSPPTVKSLVTLAAAKVTKLLSASTDRVPPSTSRSVKLSLPPLNPIVCFPYLIASIPDPVSSNIAELVIKVSDAYS